MYERVIMGFFDDYDILGGLADLVSTPFKATDTLLFGPPGEVGGLLGTPINAALENPFEAAIAVASITMAGGVLAANPVISGLTAAATSLGGVVTTRTALGSAAVAARVVPELLSSPYARSLSDAVVNTLIQSKSIGQRQALTYLSAGFVLRGVNNHIIDNYARDTVEPVRGSVVYCDLACTVEHSGIYVGHDRIVHRDGDGSIELVTRAEFLARLGGFNPAMSIYVSCAGSYAVGNEQVAIRALAMVGAHRKCSILLDNCHQFTSGCLNGNFENADNFWWSLKATAESELGCDTWGVWMSAS
jgi:hypothetical protein